MALAASPAMLGWHHSSPRPGRGDAVARSFVVARARSGGSAAAVGRIANNTKGKFIPSSPQLIALFIEVHILVKSLLVDMTKLLQLLIAVMKQFLQQQLIFSLVPIFLPGKKMS